MKCPGSFYYPKWLLWTAIAFTCFHHLFNATIAYKSLLHQLLLASPVKTSCLKTSGGLKNLPVAKKWIVADKWSKDFCIRPFRKCIVVVKKTSTTPFKPLLLNEFQQLLMISLAFTVILLTGPRLSGLLISSWLHKNPPWHCWAPKQSAEPHLPKLGLSMALVGTGYILIHDTPAVPTAGFRILRSEAKCLLMSSANHEFDDLFVHSKAPLLHPLFQSLSNHFLARLLYYPNKAFRMCSWYALVTLHNFIAFHSDSHIDPRLGSRPLLMPQLANELWGSQSQLRCSQIRSQWPKCSAMNRRGHHANTVQHCFFIQSLSERSNWSPFVLEQRSNSTPVLVQKVAAHFTVVSTSLRKIERCHTAALNCWGPNNCWQRIVGTSLPVSPHV